jgi:hypothetical protein
MSFIRSPRSWVVVLAAAAVACGIDAMGTGSHIAGGGEDGGSSSSGSAGACTPTGPEICNDGIDNDCDGKRDCEDTAACGHYTCARSEADWAVVAVTPGASAACPAGWASPRVLVSGRRSAAEECVCTCGAPSGNPCVNGTANVSFRTGQTNCNDGTFTATTDGSCQAMSSAWNDAYNGVALAPRPVANVGCTATAEPPELVNDDEVVVCDAAAAGVCADGACIRMPGAAAVCLLRPGEHAVCPAGYPSRRVLAAASAFTDARACGTCTCTTNATECADPKIAFYTDAACTTGLRSATASNACNAISATGTPTHYRYEATPNGGCAPASPTVPMTGSITPADASTLCCP